MRFGLLSIVLSLALTVLAASGPNVNSVITHLNRFQGETGGFYPAPGYPENLQDTASALFISSLFGSHARIDTNRVSQFLEKLQNPDNGYGNQAGASSDLESVRNALLSYASLGVPSPDADEVAAYLHASFDASSNLFAATKGGSGDLKSTAQALECFALLQLDNTKPVLDKHAAVKKGLTNVFKSESGRKFFSSLTSDNYYGIAVANRVGFNIGDADPWAKYFQERQAQNGGFFADADRSEVTITDTTHAILALYELDESLPNTVNLHALIDFVNNLPGSLRSAALAYQALSRTQAFGEIFKVDTAFSNSKHISWASQNIFVQGSVIKPLLSVRTAFGLSHAGLRVAVTISHDGKSQSTNLHWDAERELYHTPETFDTTGLFGELKYSFAITWDVPELPGLSRVHDVARPISYWTNILPTATFAGKPVAANGAIGYGAQFAFDLTLGTVNDPPKKSIKTGDFKVTFSVLDSSSLVIHKDSIDGNSNKDTIHFEYTLEDVNLPAGAVYFAFEIESNGVIHTRDAIAYTLSVPMVATEITFSDKKTKYQIGDTVQVSMSPATLPDLKTVQHYTTGPRQFFLQVTAPGSTTVLNQIRGECKIAKHLTCSFNIPIDATFTSLGAQQITFYYKQANGQSLALTNFDSQSGEVFEEGQNVEYFVDSLLQVVGDTHKPKSGQLVYGNKIQFTFKVQDSVSGETVWDNERSRSVFLALRHEKGQATSYTSDLSPIEVSFKDGQKQHYQVDWTVNPNAVKGASSLELVVVSGNGTETPISSGSSAWAVDVEIGGKINVEQKTYSLVLESDETAFFVDIDLSCEKAPLQDATLFATVVYVDSRSGPRVVTQQPVVLGQNGKYQVSWTLAESKAPSGTYNVNVFRAVDKKRLGDAAEPFFTTALVHSPPMSSPLPFKTEFAVTCLLVAAFFFASLKKMEIEGTNNPKKK